MTHFSCQATLSSYIGRKHPFSVDRPLNKDFTMLFPQNLIQKSDLHQKNKQTKKKKNRQNSENGLWDWKCHVLLLECILHTLCIYFVHYFKCSTVLLFIFSTVLYFVHYFSFSIAGFHNMQRHLAVGITH